MKKIIATLTVIVAAALGAQGQTTVEIPNTGSSSLTALTLDPASFTPPAGNFYEQARLLFTASAIPAGVSVTFSGITLIGDGITSSLSYSDVTLNSATTFSLTAYENLNSNVNPWTPSDGRVSFNVQISGGALATSSSIGYSVTYANFIQTQVATSAGNINIVAVPEPSAYAAAAGLLALFLWSSRRRLFKAAAGSRSALSGHSGNGVD